MIVPMRVIIVDRMYSTYTYSVVYIHFLYRRSADIAALKSAPVYENKTTRNSQLKKSKLESMYSADEQIVIGQYSDVPCVKCDLQCESKKQLTP